MNEVATVLPTPKLNMQAGKGMAAINPQTLDETFRYAEMVLMSGMFPDSLSRGKSPKETAAAVTAIILKGLEVGLPPMSALANIMEVNKRYAVWGDGAMALVRNSGKLEYAKETVTGSGENQVAVCELKRAGEAESIIRAFGVTEAKTAKLWGKVGPWMAYPTRMLQMRARSFALRDGFADVLQGLSIVEEARDFPAVDKEPVNTAFLEDSPSEIAMPVENMMITDEIANQPIEYADDE